MQWMATARSGPAPGAALPCSWAWSVTLVRWSGSQPGAWHDIFAPVEHARIMSDAARPARRAETDAAATLRAAVGGMEAGMELLRRTRPELAFESQPPPRKL